MLNRARSPSLAPIRALCDVLREWRCSLCPPFRPIEASQTWKWAIARCTHGADFDEVRACLPVAARQKLPKHVRGYLHAAIALGLVRSELAGSGVRYHFSGNELVFSTPVKDAVRAGSGKRRRRPRNDVVYTAQAFARWVVEYLQPSGRCLDPCRGRGAFYEVLRERAARVEGCTADWCETDRGRDFLERREPCDWMITNPPWSTYREIAAHAFRLARNVALLVRLHNALGTAARHRDYLQEGHGLKQIVVVDWRQAGLPPEGFTLALFHWEKGHRGDCQWRYPTFEHLPKPEQF